MLELITKGLKGELMLIPQEKLSAVKTVWDGNMWCTEPHRHHQAVYSTHSSTLYMNEKLF